jgi:hypothetical protein
LQWPIMLTERQIIICRGVGNRPKLSIPSCNCDEFRPYRIVGKEDEEEIEKQIPEVIE